MMGIEPTNAGTTIRSLNHLATPTTVLGHAPGRNRTCDQRFRRPLLYPLSYRRQQCPAKAGDETRTRDILLGRQMLYQLSYSRTL